MCYVVEHIGYIVTQDPVILPERIRSPLAPKLNLDVDQNLQGNNIKTISLNEVEIHETTWMCWAPSTQVGWCWKPKVMTWIGCGWDWCSYPLIYHYSARFSWHTPTNMRRTSSQCWTASSLIPADMYFSHLILWPCSQIYTNTHPIFDRPSTIFKLSCKAVP